MVNFNDLNSAQKKAVTSTSKHIRIIAGAGSGKTRVLTMRIAYLIEELNVRPYNILAITFTNKAANEMKKRINEMLKEEGTGAHISTIHSLCVSILSQDIKALNYPSNFTIVDASDQQAILKQAYKQFNIDKKEYPYGSMLDYIANNKCADISPTRAKELAYKEYKLENKAKVYEFYDTYLKKMYALDFDDLILFTIRLFKTNPQILQKWSSRFKYIHVDEFQDIDPLQYTLIRQLTSVNDNIYVVGDPDQTIYSWRGADINIIVNFNLDYKNTETIILDQNYRSTNNILSGANSLIENNKARVEKKLFSLNGDGHKIIHKALSSETAEAYYVVNQIIKLHNDGYNYGDLAVLYRANYLSREVEKVLIENHINYVIYGGLKFYERKEIKDILCYLRMITRSDDLALKRIINIPTRGIGQKTIDAIEDLAISNNITMFEVLKKGIYPKNKDTFNNFVQMIEKWQAELDNVDLSKLLSDVLDDSGYRSMLEKDEETERMENIKSLIDDIKQYSINYPESSLDDYLQLIALYTDKASDQVGESISLATVHSAKGLEFEVVFVIGLSEGIFPSQKSMLEGKKGLEEERRLAYVAFTRAKKLLYLTESNSFSYVLSSSKLPSRFINEIDDKYIEHVDKVNTINNNNLLYDKDIRINSNYINTNKASYVPGEHVKHSVYGQGVVISEANGIVSIAFPSPIGIKKILANHPTLSKITDSKNYS